MQCSICLDDLDASDPTLACGHRFHASCLARLAGANGTTPTRRGALTTCPNCRTVSRVAVTPVAAFGVGDRVEALWGQKWYPGEVDAIVDGGRAYEIVFDDGDESEVRAAHVRAAPAPARTARPPPVQAPPAPPPAPPPPRASGPPPPRRSLVPGSGRFPCPAGCGRTFDHAPAAVAHGKSCTGTVRPPALRAPARPLETRGAPVTYPCPASCGCGLPHRRCGGCAPCRAKRGDACLAPRALPAPVPLPPATRQHVASTSSAWVAACTELLEAAKDSTNMKALREPLVSRGFHCGTGHPLDGRFLVDVPPDFPCYYDVVGKDYASSSHGHAQSLFTLRKYLEGTLALARAGGEYRTDADYKQAPAPVRAAPVRTKTSRFAGVRGRNDSWCAEISVRGSKIPLGTFDEEEDAARAFDAAVVKYRNAPTVNFPGEAPLASVLAALPAAPPVAPPVPAALPRRSGRAPAPKVIFDAPDERKPSLKRRAQKKRETGMHGGKTVEGAQQKSNGKWSNSELFPGREFDDLDAYRAAKKQHVAQKYR